MGDVKQVEHFSQRVRGGRGTLIIDERASGGERREMATLTCAHCGCVVVLNHERKRKRNRCYHCNAYVCDDKVCATTCAPIEKSVELAQKYPGLQTLPRGYNGELLFDPAYLEKGKVY